MTDPGSEPLSGPDNAWWRMGDRTNLMEITGVLVFEDPIEYDDLVETIAERLLPFRRFRQRIVPGGPGRRPRWELDPKFDVEGHVHHVALPEPQDSATFQSYVGDLMSRPIDTTKPLWQAYLVEGAADGNALVVRIHHSIADGFALLYVLLGLADDPSQINLPLGSMPSPPDHARTDTDEAGDTASGDGTDDHGRSHFAEIGDTQAIRTFLERAASMPPTAYRALTMDDEPRTSLVGDLGVAKQVAWTDPIPIEDVKAAGRPHDATINDVLLAATSGAIRRHLQENGEDVSDLTLRATVPVNLRPLDQRTESLGNYFGLGFLELPVHEPDVERRLDHVKENTGELKQGTEAYLLYLLLAIFGQGPGWLQEKALKLFRDKATAVVTNVPGPTEAFELCGQEVSDIVFWVPQSNGIGLGISLLSYDGDIRVGVAADRGLLPEPVELAEAFEAEFEAITAEVDGEADG